MRTKGAHVLLTGATGTVGTALSHQLTEHGAQLTLVARTPGPLQALTAQTGAAAFPADLCDGDTMTGLVDRIEVRHGPVDILINGAAAATTGTFWNLSAEDLRRTLELNLTAPLELCRQVLPGMLARGKGYLVNISSLAGVATFPGLAVYGGSKAGLTHATSGLRADLRDSPVHTLAVEIGPVASVMMDRIVEHPPAAAAFDRLLRARFLSLLNPDVVAAAVIAAVEQGHHHLRLPKRAAPLAAVTGTPRALTRMVLSGIPGSGPVTAQQVLR